MPETQRRPLTLPSDRDASGRDLGELELAYLRTVIESGHLNSTGGRFVPKLEENFAKRHSVAHAVACASGSAAVHTAIAALGLAPGDEVVTTPITDIGAIVPILYEGLVPVFCDVDPDTALVTAETIDAVLTDRTRAVIVTHLFGAPCDMRPINELAGCRDIRVVEDAAQAFLASDHGKLVGAMGDVACYSFQQGKHMTTGEGGIVITDDADLQDRMRRFVNKGWGYGDAKPDHDRAGLNYRLTELQAAVGAAQLEKLDSVVDRRRTRARELDVCLAGIDGIATPICRPDAEHSYWRYVLRVAESAGGPGALGARLREWSIPNAPSYIQKPAFDCAMFRGPDRDPLVVRTLDGRTDPLGGPDTHPGAYAALAQMLVLPWNEQLTREHVRYLADGIVDALTRA